MAFRIFPITRSSVVGISPAQRSARASLILASTPSGSVRNSKQFTFGEAHLNKMAHSSAPRTPQSITSPEPAAGPQPLPVFRPVNGLPPTPQLRSFNKLRATDDGIG